MATTTTTVTAANGSNTVANNDNINDTSNLCPHQLRQPFDMTIVENQPPVVGDHYHQQLSPQQPPQQQQSQYPSQSSPIGGMATIAAQPPPPYSAIPGTVPLYMSRASGPPPSYDDVINPEAPPPSYQSLFGQVREARKSANNIWDFLRKLIVLLIGTLGCTIIIGFALVIPLSMIIIGSVYMNECHVENIPEFLFIGGVVWIFKNLMNVWAQCRRSAAANGANPIDTEQELRYRKHESLLNCFLFGWFIAGCVVVYRAYIPDFEDRTSKRYCHRTVYLYAFWLVTSTFIGFALFMTCLCGLTMSAVFTNVNDEELRRRAADSNS